MSLQVVAKVSEVILARLEPKEDLLLGIRRVCREQNIRTGVIMDITGALEVARLERFPAKPAPDLAIEVVEIPGPLEATGHGIIGETDAPEHGNRPFSHGGFVHGEPYMHVHLVVTSHNESICGHLVEGCRVRSTHPISHFTVVIGKLEGAVLKLRCDCGGVKGQTMRQFPDRDRGRVYHDLVKT